MSEPALRRGALLLAIHGQYPLPFALPALERAVDLVYSMAPDEFRRDVHYLESKALIEHRRSKVRGQTIEVVELTPLGVDVAEGTVKVPGIDIERAVVA